MIEGTDLCRFESANPTALGVFRNQSDLTGIVFSEPVPGSLPIIACRETRFRREH